MDHFIERLRRIFGRVRGQRIDTPEPPPEPRAPRPRVQPHTEVETAHHEAGHALAAWFSPYTLNVLEASILPGQAFVRPATWDTGTSYQLYDWTVVCMAGLAGVLRVRNRVRSYPFASDLSFALETAKKLDGLGMKLPLQHHDQARSPRFDVSKMYRVEPSRRVAIVLNDALEEARERIERHPGPFKRLVDALLEHKTLTATDLPAIMGPRPWAPGGR